MKTLILTVLLALVTFGCQGNEEVHGTFTKGEITPLAKVLESPEQFHKKEVTFKGIVDSQCGSRCEFFFREGNKVVPIFMGDIKAPAIKKGTPVTVTASVHKGDEQVILTAKGFALSTKGGK